MDRAWRLLGGHPLLLEEFIPFDRELSQIAVRGRDGAVAFYPLVENHHEHGILRWSLAPAPGVSAELQAAASDYALRILRELDYVGVLAVEFFQRGDGLIANEMAPRVHNSGHWTIEGAETSQFENHLRAVVGWPLGSTAAVGCSAMLNLIGARRTWPRCWPCRTPTFTCTARRRGAAGSSDTSPCEPTPRTWLCGGLPRPGKPPRA